MYNIAASPAMINSLYVKILLAIKGSDCDLSNYYQEYFNLNVMINRILHPAHGKLMAERMDFGQQGP